MASSFSPTDLPGGAPPREDSPPPAPPQSPSPSSPEPSAPLSPFYQTVLVGVSASAPASAAVVESPGQTPLHLTPEATSEPPLRLISELLSEPVSKPTFQPPADLSCEPTCEGPIEMVATQKVMTPEATPLREIERMQSVVSTTEKETPVREIERMQSVVSTTEKATPLREIERIQSVISTTETATPAHEIERTESVVSITETATPAHEIERTEGVVSITENATPARQSEPVEQGMLKIEQDAPASEVKIAKVTKPANKSSTFKRPAESEAMSSRPTKQKSLQNTDLGPRTLKLYTEHASSRSGTKPLIKIEPELEPVKAENPAPTITLLGDSLILAGYDISSRREGDTDIDTPKDPEWARLFSAWTMGARLQSTSFMDAVSDAIVAKLPVSMLAASLDEELLAHAGQESAMRRLLVDIVALAWTDGSFELESLSAGDEHFRLMALLLLRKTGTITAKPRKMWFKKKAPCSNYAENKRYFLQSGGRYHMHVQSNEPCYKRTLPRD
ncbi:hypothetical protein B0A48_08520 [Cryoendolithus antarcticus]|uniref:Uncharacterized protein n=1 Tax=Cryoendolithus antarcticus TaxID=1507870 RepID=A0A1V8T5P0_9PEZI|nr:hypothetical protein B0A48_08520 [Cryoendolithus antarcticus]